MVYKYVAQVPQKILKNTNFSKANLKEYYTLWLSQEKMA